jgi:CRP/FNR family transcriptional regulator, cyclic AMP receptor protein
LSVHTIAEYLAVHPFFADLDADTVAELAGCARNLHVRSAEYLFREGGAAEHFYVVLSGRISLELFSPGGAYVVDSVGEGEVLDWPWLIPPHKWMCDARAIESARVVALDSACLRGKCEADARLGYRVMQRVAQDMARRLQTTQVRLLDLYGVPKSRNASDG